MRILLGWLEQEALDMRQIDLVIEPKAVGDDDDPPVVFYHYFANHHSRCIFWCKDFDAKNIISGCKGVENLSHLRG